MTDKGNGWRSGKDPIQRWLRIVTAIVALGVFVLLAVNDDKGSDDLVVITLALGSLLLLLGYESVIRIPVIGRGKEDDDA